MASIWDTPPTEDEMKGGGVFDTPPTPEEMGESPEKPGWGTTALNAIGRGAWALPGLVGLDYETAAAAADALDVPLVGEDKPGTFRERYGAAKKGYLEQSRQVDAAHPVASGLTRGVAAAPGEALAWALAPEVKGPKLAGDVLSKVAPYVERALAYGPRIGTLAGASEYGSTAHKDPADRVAGAGVAGALGTLFGGGMAAALPAPSVLAPGAHQATPEALAARSAAFGAGQGGEAASGAAARSGAAGFGQGGDAAAQNATDLVIRPPKRSRLVPKALQEPEPIPEAQYLLNRGVPLTGGLKDPGSAYGHTEIASQSVGLVGPGIRKQRGQALEDAMHLAFEEARPPGPATRAANLAPEEYLYHVTPAENAESIAKQGLRIDAEKIAEGGPHADTRAVFLADADTVPTYRDLYGSGDAPLAVYRVPRSALSSLEDDTASEGAAYLSRENIPAELLERETPAGWSSVTSPRLRRDVGKAGDINEKYARLKGQWDEAWSAVRAKDELIQPAILEGDFGVPLKVAVDQVVDDVADPLAAVWDDVSRAQAHRFLDNQFTRLNAGAKDQAGRVPLGDMLRVLSDIRAAKRAALEGDKRDLYQILARSEDAFEQALETQASPATAAEIRALNAGYRNFKIVEDAVIRAKDAPGGISPAQLSLAVRGAEASRSRYAAGGGGPIRELSKSVRTVFDESGAPPTGARVLAVAPEWLNRWATAPTIYFRNASSLKAGGGNAGALAGAGADAGARAAGGSAAAGADAMSVVPTPVRDAVGSILPAPRTATPMSSAITPELARWLAQFGYPRPGLLPGVADEDEPR